MNHRVGLLDLLKWPWSRINAVRVDRSSSDQSSVFLHPRTNHRWIRRPIDSSLGFLRHHLEFFATLWYSQRSKPVVACNVSRLPATYRITSFIGRKNAARSVAVNVMIFSTTIARRGKNNFHRNPSFPFAISNPVALKKINATQFHFQ